MPSIIWLTTVALALLTATPMPPSGAQASFVYGMNSIGGQVFDLQVPASQWQNFSHGERLDAEHQTLGPQTWRAVCDYVDRATKKAGVCRAGWMLGEYSADNEGTRHFKGVCVKAPIAT